jgi:RNA-directed DNA polymerase
MVTLEQVLCRANMFDAYNRVVSNKGAPGVDGITVGDLKEHLCRHWVKIREEIVSGSYRPQPVLKVEIPKPDGKGKRMLGIPTTTDRLIQQALLQVLQPALDPLFSEHSFGFRPKRSAHQAVLAAREHIAAGHRWVVDMDLEKFFDRVNHDVLMSRLARRIKDKRILLLIRRYLQAGIMEDGLVCQRVEGTPQGGPLSPLLSNVLLDDLDKELERRGHRFVRYADDCNIYVRSRRSGERVLDSIEGFLRDKLRLVVNRQKSAVGRPWKRKFLGYTVTVHHQPKLRIAPASVHRLKAKLRAMFRRGRGRSVWRTIQTMKPILRGWLNYFRLADVKACLVELDRWIRRKLRCILWRQWKRPRTRMKELIKRGIGKERARLSAGNGHGPWWNAKASHMNQAVPTRWFRDLGLYSLLENYQRMKCLT